MAAKSKAPKAEAPKAEAPKAEAPKAPKAELVREFTLGPGNYDKASGYDHGANKAEVLNGARRSGYRVIGDVELVGIKTHLDGKSQVLTYKVAVAKTGA